MRSGRVLKDTALTSRELYELFEDAGLRIVAQKRIQLQDVVRPALRLARIHVLLRHPRQSDATENSMITSSPAPPKLFSARQLLVNGTRVR